MGVVQYDALIRTRDGVYEHRTIEAVSKEAAALTLNEGEKIASIDVAAPKSPHTPAPPPAAADPLLAELQALRLEVARLGDLHHRSASFSFGRVFLLLILVLIILFALL